MRGKRKPESPLKSEPSPKIRRLSTASHQEEAQDSPVACSPSFREQNGVPSSRSTPAPLTKENLRRLEDMTNSRGPPSVGTTPSNSKTGTGVPTDSKSRYSTTEAPFKERFRGNHALDCYQSQAHPCVNEPQIRKDFFRSRDSASPPRSEHLTIGQMLEEASNEREIEAIVTNYILKPATTEPGLVGIRYKAKFDKQWTAFPKDVGFNNGLAAPKPDLTEGYMRKTFPPIINGLGGCATLVKDDPNYVALPHFVAEFKDVGKNMKQGEIQAGYDGAAMVYARNQALDYLEQPDPPRHAAVASVISDGHNWKVFIHYAHENKDTKEIEWYQIKVAGGDLYNYEDFKSGRAVLRNVQDWGRKQSTDLRDRLQRHYELDGATTGGAPAKAGPTNSDKNDGMSRKSGSRYSSGRDTASRAPSSGSSGTSSKHNGKQRALLDQRAMPPPPGRSSGASSSRDGEQRAPAGGKEARRPPPGIAGGPRPAAPRSSNASVASDDRRPAQGPPANDRARDGCRDSRSDGRERERQRGREQDRYRDYRDRTSGDDIAPVPRRRSDSPQDKARLLRPQGKDKIDRGRATSGDRRVDRYESGSAGSGSSTSTSTRVSAKPPAVPAVKVKSGMFSNNKPVKKPQGND